MPTGRALAAKPATTGGKTMAGQGVKTYAMYVDGVKMYVDDVKMQSGTNRLT